MLPSDLEDLEVILGGGEQLQEQLPRHKVLPVHMRHQPSLSVELVEADRLHARQLGVDGR